MQRPVSIKLFAILFSVSAMVSLALAIHAAQAAHFGFKLPPDAARTLAYRIMAIRFAGVALAMALMMIIVLWKSRGARAALGGRWLLGLVTSIAFLRGIGLLAPLGASGTAVIAASIAQLIIEGIAILILYGEDAATWFERRRIY